MTGWNLPPGCNVRDLPGNEEYPCQICGRYDDHCICPECPVCGSYGDPRCYDDLDAAPGSHGLLTTQAQRDAYAEYVRAMEDEARAEAAWAEEMQRREDAP